MSRFGYVLAVALILQLTIACSDDKKGAAGGNAGPKVAGSSTVPAGAQGGWTPALITSAIGCEASQSIVDAFCNQCVIPRITAQFTPAQVAQAKTDIQNQNQTADVTALLGIARDCMQRVGLTPDSNVNGAVASDAFGE